MKILEDINASSSPSRSCALTIGSFDGVHLGHQKILEAMRERVGPEGTICACTFTNHPTHVLPGRNPVPLIFSKELKLLVLSKLGVDITYCIPFDKELAALSYEDFLRKMMKACPFDYLILGVGASIGRRREGTPDKLIQLGKTMGFACEFIEKKKVGEETISSNTIRKLIQGGNLARAAEFLGHPFMIECEIKDKEVSVSPLICLPPDGNYPVLIDQKKNILSLKDNLLTLQSSSKSGKATIVFSTEQ